MHRFSAPFWSVSFTMPDYVKHKRLQRRKIHNSSISDNYSTQVYSYSKAASSKNSSHIHLSLLLTLYISAAALNRRKNQNGLLLILTPFQPAVNLHLSLNHAGNELSSVYQQERRKIPS